MSDEEQKMKAKIKELTAEIVTLSKRNLMLHEQLCDLLRKSDERVKENLKHNNCNNK